jgi:hypothetical protein
MMPRRWLGRFLELACCKVRWHRQAVDAAVHGPYCLVEHKPIPRPRSWGPA